MRWEDEHYVKLYTRDSLTWKSWAWQTRTVFLHLLRKVDGAGILQCEGFEPVEAAALMLDLPPEVVEPGLAQLAKCGTAEIGSNVIILPKYIDAQEARKTEKLRKRDQRQRDRDQARAAGFVGSDAGADAVAEVGRHTESHGVTPDVTRGHARSRDVTRGHSPSSSPSSSSSPSPTPEEPLSSANAAGETLEFALAPTAPKSDPSAEVVAHYVEAMRANGVEVRDTPSKRKLAKKALKTWSPDDLRRAIDGLTLSDWHMGRDPKSNGGSWTGLEYAIGDDKRIEANLQRAKATGPPPRASNLPPCSIHACDGSNTSGMGLCQDHWEEFKADPETQRTSLEERLSLLHTWIQDRNARSAA